MIENTDELLSHIIPKLEYESEQINPERKESLINLAKVFDGARQSAGHLNIIVICTHNSRRSQLAQLWLELGISYYQLEDCSSYSGGTEATAFNPLMVKGIKDFGIGLKTIKQGNNPTFEVDNWSKPLKNQYFSKVYHEHPNPKSDFVAILVCSDAEQACPLVSGALKRFYLPYQDPKLSDGTEHESTTYLGKVSEIGREMIFLLKQFKSRIETGQK